MAMSGKCNGPDEGCGFLHFLIVYLSDLKEGHIEAKTETETETETKTKTNFFSLHTSLLVYIDL